MIRCHGEARRAIRRVKLPRAPFPTSVRVADQLEVTWEAPDRDDASRLMRITMTTRLRLPCTEAAFFEQVRDAVIRVYVHEAREALLVDGVRRFDPVEDHPPVMP